MTELQQAYRNARSAAFGSAMDADHGWSALLIVPTDDLIQSVIVARDSDLYFAEVYTGGAPVEAIRQIAEQEEKQVKKIPVKLIDETILDLLEKSRRYVTRRND